jgi:hypothetical protein
VSQQSVVYVYELHRDNEISATGMLSLDFQPQVGQTLRIAGDLAEVDQLMPLGDGRIRQVLRSLAR